MSLPVPDFPDYLVDETGKIWSNKTHKYLKPAYTHGGYASVELFNGKGSRRLLIHRIVAKCFLPNPSKLPQVNHKDENPKNNRVDNLEWCTAKYNMNYGNGAKTRHLKIDYSKPCYRENAIKNGMKVARPVLQFNIEGTLIERFSSAKEASKKTGADHSHIIDCCKGKPHRYTAGGFVWKYERSGDISRSHV